MVKTAHVEKETIEKRKRNQSSPGDQKKWRGPTEWTRAECSRSSPQAGRTHYLRPATGEVVDLPGFSPDAEQAAHELPLLAWQQVVHELPPLALPQVVHELPPPALPQVVHE